jgi:hypothetical protein
MAAVISVTTSANGKETDGSPVVFSFSRPGSTDAALARLRLLQAVLLQLFPCQLWQMGH